MKFYVFVARCLREVFPVFAALLFFAFSPAAVLADVAEKKMPPPPRVLVSRIVEQDISPVTEYVGHIEAIQAVDLRARVEGFLEKVAFAEGDMVSQGQLLYVIEQAPYQARLAAARARVAEARAEEARTGQHLERLRKAKPESIPATDLDNAEAAVLMAAAKRAEAEAQLAIAELDYSYTTVKAPIAGRIGRTAYTRGNLVGPASGALARIVQVDPIRVVYAVSENDLNAIMTALGDVDGGRGNRLLAPELRLADGVLVSAGRVAFVDNQIDAATGTIAVRAAFANGAGRLIPGQYVTAVIRASQPRLQPLVPQEAVMIDKSGAKVLVVDQANVVQSRPLRVGPAHGFFWVVESGLAAGELVVVQGLQKVRPGQTVLPEIREGQVR
ncbi:MAG TPA: efflux RND transporter periplasmic adaptor subunit [Proteobacteria bacterium]|nr:efflux RND transporter periplasmic adaptor subunit [Pseudomonadota bacterium]